jgi:hypothetical protein
MTFPAFEDEGQGSVLFEPFNFTMTFNPTRNEETGNFEILLDQFALSLSNINITTKNGEIMKYLTYVIDYIHEGLMY